jgi:hypothetical protein
MEIAWYANYTASHAWGTGYYWVARVTGNAQGQISPKGIPYKVLREFLPRTWPSIFRAGVPPAYNLRVLQPGDIIECRKGASRFDQVAEWYQVTAINDSGASLAQMTPAEVTKIFHEAEKG